MLRHLLNVVPYVLQSLRRNIKPLILIVSFITFVWLIVDTAHRPEFVRHASKHSFRFRNRTGDEAVERWDERSVQQFLYLLEIDLNVTDLNVTQDKTGCPQESTFLFTAFAEGSLLETLWHYFSLVALWNSVGATAGGHRVQIMLTSTARTALGTVFASVPLGAIDEDTIRCHDLAGASVLNDNTEIELPVGGNQMYMLNNQAKRLQEIVEVPWETQSHFFTSHTDVLEKANAQLLRLRNKMPYTNTAILSNLQFVCIHIREDDELPFAYYYRAITFQRKMHDAGRLLFVVICEDPKSQICHRLGAPSEGIEVLPEQDDPAVDFALMRLCNHTIVSSETDIFPALLRGSVGNTIVYGASNNISQPIVDLANFKERWYTIV